MSCTLILIRHGIAEDPQSGMSDTDRELTADGVRKMTRAARGLRRLGVRPDAILSSPLRRAEQTAARLQRVLCPDTPVEIYTPLAPDHDPADALRGLIAYQAARQLVLVGHQPDMGELASFLVSGSATQVVFDFKKGTAVAITVSALPPRSPGLLEWFLTPKLQRTLGRPRR